MRVIPARNVVLLATGSRDKKVRLYSSPITNTHFTLKSFIQHTYMVTAVEFNTPGTSILSSEYLGKLLITDVRVVSNPKTIKLLHFGVICVHWLNNGGIIVCTNNHLHIFDKHFSCKKFRLASKVEVTAMAYSGDTIVVGDNKGWMFRFSLRDPSKVIRQVDVAVKYGGPVCDVSILDDDICVYACYATAYVWDMKNNTTEKIAHPQRVEVVHVPLKGGHVFITTCYDGYVRMYDGRCKPSRMLFKVSCANCSYGLASCSLPGQQGGLFVVGCGGSCEVFRCVSLPIDKVRMCVGR